jgi:hypothetical protein
MEFSRLTAERMDRLELALEPSLGRNSRGWLRRGWTSWNGLWSWIWAGILEAACGEDVHRLERAWNWIWDRILEAGCGEDVHRLERAWNWIWERILEAGCGEDVHRLARSLELDLGQNSRGGLRRGWTGWHGAWSWIWERILEAACGEDGHAGTGLGSGSGKEFSRLLAERMGRLERALELSRLPAEKMDRLARGLELELGKNS